MNFQIKKLEKHQLAPNRNQTIFSGLINKMEKDLTLTQLRTYSQYLVSKEIKIQDIAVFVAVA